MCIPEPVTGEFDQHLAALSFLGSRSPTLNSENSTYLGYELGGNALNQQKQPAVTPGLMGWYSGHVSLYGLLEQDLDGIASGYFGDDATVDSSFT